MFPTRILACTLACLLLPLPMSAADPLDAAPVDLVAGVGWIPFDISDPGGDVREGRVIDPLAHVNQPLQRLRDLDDVEIDFYLDGAYLGRATRDIPAATWGTSIAVPCGCPFTAPLGVHTLRVVVDPRNLIPEIDEANNDDGNTQDIAPAASPHHNLRVTLDVAPPLAAGGDATIRWAAYATGGDAGTNLLRIEADGVTIATHRLTSVRETPFLSIAQSGDVSWPMPAGPHTFRAVIDAAGEVAEANEADNEATTTRAVGDGLLPRWERPVHWTVTLTPDAPAFADAALAPIVGVHRAARIEITCPTAVVALTHTDEPTYVIGDGRTTLCAGGERDDTLFGTTWLKGATKFAIEAQGLGEVTASVHSIRIA